MSEIVTQLKALKLNGMAHSYAELISEGRNASMQISEWLIKHLIEAETTDREVFQASIERHGGRECAICSLYGSPVSMAAE